VERILVARLVSKGSGVEAFEMVAVHDRRLGQVIETAARALWIGRRVAGASLLAGRIRPVVVRDDIRPQGTRQHKTQRAEGTQCGDLERTSNAEKPHAANLAIQAADVRSVPVLPGAKVFDDCIGAVR